MSKLLIAMITALTLVGSTPAEVATTGATAKPVAKATKHPRKKLMDCVWMSKGGKMMMRKDGKTAAVEADVTLTNGTVVKKDGSLTMKDGTKGMMTGGERMDMEGNVLKPTKAWKKHAAKNETK